MSTRIRIVIANDHPMIHGGLITSLHAEPSINIAGEAFNGKEVVNILSKKRVHVVLLDANMPVLDGIATTKRIRSQKRKVKVLMMVEKPSKHLLRKIIAAHVNGIILMNADKEEILLAINAVYGGKFYYSAAIKDMGMEILSGGIKEGEAEISDLEKDIVKHLKHGLTTKASAKELNKSPDTIKSHKTKLYRIFNASNASELVSIIDELGLLD